MKHNLIIALLLAVPAWAASETLSTAPQQENLKAVQQQINALQKDIAQKQAVKKQTQTAIEQSAAAIAKTDQALQQLSKKQDNSTARLLALQQQTEQTQKQVLHTQQKVSTMLNRQYKNGDHDAMRLMLNGADPNKASRDLVYYRYIAEAQQQLIADLILKQQTLAQMQTELQTQLDQLVRMSDRKNMEKSQLKQSQVKQQQQVSQLGSEIMSSTQQLSKLKEDEKRLTNLIAKIEQQRAAQRARERAAFKARQEAARKENLRRRKLAAEARKQGKPVPKEAKTEVPVETVDTAADNSNAGRAFRSLQGRMKLPVTGEIAGRFGEQRNEGTTWKGVFIRTERGQPVHAVADGRVVYADALRGFGNAIIVDHGGNYLTVYTGLANMSRGVGDRIKAGDTLGTTGALDSGQSGLYFEIRHLGKPINPLTWAH